jgi:hypothetical protein
LTEECGVEKEVKWDVIEVVGVAGNAKCVIVVGLMAYLLAAD